MSGELKFYSRFFTFEVQENNLALVVELKNEWSDTTFKQYAEVLHRFINYIDSNNYSLILKCSEFKVCIGRLRGLLKPFLQTYKDAGFKVVKVITENPQKEFRRMVKESNESIGFEMMFCNSMHINQVVHI